MALIYGLYLAGRWRDERGVNVLDTGAPWYDVYETKDGKWLAVGAIEQRFYAEFVEKLGLAAAELPKQHDRKGWPVLRRALRRGHRRHARATNGSACSRAAMPASPRCWRWARSSSTPTTWRAAPSCGATACCSPAPRRASAAPHAEMGAPPRPRGADSEAVLARLGLRRRRDRQALKQARNRGRGQAAGALSRWTFAHPAQQEIREAILQDLRPLRRRLLAGEGPRRRLSRMSSTARIAERLARHRHAGGLRRLRARHHRSRRHDAGGRRVGRGVVGRLGACT